jgi:hypothetical protein
MIFAPDSFARDPYGYATNQAGHAYLVGAPAALILAPWWGLIAAPAVIAVVYWLAWEIGVQRGRLWWDSFEDAVHVMAGASVICALMSGDRWIAPGCLLAQAVLLCVGIWRRSR